MSLPYDGILLVSFGGPESSEEVMPFLRHVTRGRGVPDERLEHVAEHYHHMGGRSPINDQGRALAAALEAESSRRGTPSPVYFGNRNSAPWLVDALREAVDAGARRLAVVLTSGYSSYSGCRQYRENIADALQALRDQGCDESALPVLDKLVTYGPTDVFVEPMARLVTDALADLLDEGLDPSMMRLAFVTHSIPTAMNDASGPPDVTGAYAAQHLEVQERIVEVATQALGDRLSAPLRADAVYCSRSGAPHIPWTEPDVNDWIEQVAGDGARHVVVVPHGFVSDHMEVIWDLDHEAAETAQEHGVGFTRVPTVGTDPAFVAGLMDLVEARGRLDRAGQDCARDCCLSGRPGAPARPHACGV